MLLVDTSGSPLLTLPVSTAPKTAATPTLANVAGSATVVTLLALNTARLGAIVFNDSTSAMYIKYGSAASATSFTYKVLPGGTWEMPGGVVYTGILTALWDTANGNARVTELAA